MRHSVFAAPLLLLASGAFAILEIPVAKRDRHTNGQTAHLAHGLIKRSTADTLETTLFAGFTTAGAYFVNVTAGTPPQLQTVLLDTGSSDLFFDSSSSSDCNSKAHPCLGGTYNPGDSKTYKQVLPPPGFSTRFGDGTTDEGSYASDRVCINDICIDDVEFGIADTIKTTVGPSTGLMGIGYANIEAATTKNKYPNIPNVLSDAGVINSRLFSLYLNNRAAITGAILFGGIDLDKYTGTMQTVNMLPDPITGYIDQYITCVTEMKITASGKTTTAFSGGKPGVEAFTSSSGSLPVLLDSGSSAWTVPSSVYNAIVKEFTFVDAKTGIASCSNLNTDNSITVTFNDQIAITVSINEFLVPIYTTSGDPENLSNGDQACALAIVPVSEKEAIEERFLTMGDAMMRGMYIVYDLENGQFGLATAKLDSTTSDIKAVPAGPGGIAKVARNGKAIGGQSSFSVFPSVPATVKFDVSTAKSAIGTRTGIAAVPTNARVSGEAKGANGGSGSSAAPSLFFAENREMLFVVYAAVLAVVGGAFLL